MKKIFLLLLTSYISHFTSLEAQTEGLIEKGKAKQKDGSHSDAIADFTSAIKQNDPEVQKYLSQMEEYDKIPAFEKAEKGIEAPPVDVNFATPYYLRGYSYSTTGKNSEALGDFNTAIKINPNHGAAYYQRGKLLWSTGKKDEGCIDLGMAGSLKDSSAREMFDEKFCSKEAVAAHQDASSKVRINDFQGALDQIQKAIKLCPDSAIYLGTRGRAYLGLALLDKSKSPTGLGKYELAMHDFDKAISLSKTSVDAYYGRGVAYYTKGKWQESFDDLAKAILLDERFADAYLYRAYACEGMDKNQSALFDYQQVQRLKPGETLAFFKSGLLRNSMGDTKSACKDFARAASMGHSEAQDYIDKICNVKTKAKGK